MPKTLLAVDDSATMRKVLEITFTGEDFRVVTAEGTARAMTKLSEEPVAAVIDTSLEGDDGYALAKQIRGRDPRIAIVLMASRYTPYDANRGRDAGVDDSIDKPFDTQALIDKVKKALSAREAHKAAAVPAPVAAAPPPAPQPTAGAVQRPMAPTVPSAGVPRPIFPTQRTHTLSFEGNIPAVTPPAPPAASSPGRVASFGSPPAQPPAPIAPAVIVAPPPAPAPSAATAPTPPARPAAAPAAPVAAPVPVAAAAAPVAAAVNGQLAGKLSELGLTPHQADAVLALSREVVERVVWEVVPQLAEALIKEEIVRLTRD